MPGAPDVGLFHALEKDDHRATLPRRGRGSVVMAWIHLTARMSSDCPLLTRDDTGAWLWTWLRHAFPEALAVTLMPDHPHLVVPSTNPEAERLRLARLLGQFGRRFGVGGRASVAPMPEPIRPGGPLARQIRYVALNPCRARIVACPLAWRWSTHRDIVGATLDPWVTAERLAAALGMRTPSFVARHHAYVSGDPHARVDGTPLPEEGVSRNMPSMPLQTIAEAVTAATRTPIAAIRRGRERALFVALAFDQGWKNVGQLAEICDCCERTIRNHAAAVDARALRITRMCLTDARLRRR
jgi:hypothetical protein